MLRRTVDRFGCLDRRVTFDVHTVMLLIHADNLS
jgi:hypothetical protein